MAIHDDGTLVCDACGRNHGPVSVDLDSEGRPVLPSGWRQDSRYQYCHECGPVRIRTMDELEAQVAAATEA